MKPFGVLASLFMLVFGLRANAMSGWFPPSQFQSQSPFTIPRAALAYKYERLDKTDAVLLVVDHQEGLYQLVHDRTPVEFKNNILAHAALGQVFNLPVVLTSSSDTGPNGPLTKEILAMFPDAPFIRRQGEVNAWDNPDFKAAVEATGKKQVILAGITTDVCTAFLALSLVDAGYSVFANGDASGTFDKITSQDANDRMRDAGVQVLSMFAVALELMRDWRDTPGAPELLPFFDTYLPEYGFLARAHDAAVLNGTLSGLPAARRVTGDCGDTIF